MTDMHWYIVALFLIGGFISFVGLYAAVLFLMDIILSVGDDDE